MALEMDKTTEARRKALRNGEEDPVVVAQRFLNIYRQMHILSPERKEAFNKMLLELSPDIRGIFSSLPGGAMLQDYADELAEQSGLEKSSHLSMESHLNEEAHKQAQILATALAKAQSQNISAAPAPTIAGTTKVSFDKDFAVEFAKTIGGVIQQQTSVQKESLEKLVADLNKTQLFIAKNMKDNKDEQHQELEELCRTISAGNEQAHADRQKEFAELCKLVIASLKAGREEQTRGLSELCKMITESYQNTRAEQNIQIGELCKAIMQSQTALSASLSNLNREDSLLPQAKTETIDNSTRKLIEVVLDGQKQLNQRLDKVEILSAEKANDNKELIKAFEKTQAEMVKGLGRIKDRSPAVRGKDDTEKLIKAIGESQNRLIKELLSVSVLQNNTAQANNNANNIQINTPDNSSQIVQLTEKIASLQASNEQNIEKAITRTIEEQGKLYDKISRRQTKELAEMLALALKETNLSASSDLMAQPIRQENPLPEAEEAMPESFFGEEALSTDDYTEILTPTAEEQTSSTVAEKPQESFLAEEEKTQTKKKKKKIKKKKTTDIQSAPTVDVQPKVEDITPPEAENTLEEDDELPKITGSFQENADSSNMPSEISDVVPAVSTESRIPEENQEISTGSIAAASPDLMFNETETKDITDEQFGNAETILTSTSDDWGFTQETSKDEQKSAARLEETGSDWGFISADNEKNFTGNNDNKEDQDWEWVYVEDDGSEAYPAMEAIGDNSYICSSDLFSQEKVINSGPLVYGSTPVELSTQPFIVDNDAADEVVDPYQNSILKD